MLDGVIAYLQYFIRATAKGRVGSLLVSSNSSETLQARTEATAWHQLTSPAASTHATVTTVI